MTETNHASEAAASSYLPSDAELQHIAIPGGGSRVQAMAAEILRMRRDCPPTAEVEKLRNALMSCAKAAYPNTFGPIPAGDVHIDFLCEDVQKEVGHLRADRDVWKQKADTLGKAIDAADREFLRAGVVPFDGSKVPVDVAMRQLADEVAGLRSTGIRDAVMAFDTFLRRCGVKVSRLEGLMPVPWVIEAAKLLKDAWPRTADNVRKALTEEAQTAIAAMRDVGPELAKAGMVVGQRVGAGTPPMTHAEAVAQLRGERDQWREKCEAAQRLVDEAGRFEGAVVADLAAHGVFATGGLGGVRFAVGKALAELARLRKESKRDQVAKQQALLDEIARLFPGKGDLMGRLRPYAKLATSISARRSFPAKPDPLPGDWCGTNRPEMPQLQPAAASLEEKRKRLVADLAQVVNRYSLEHACGDTPDFLIAELMLDAAMAFGKHTRGREAHATGRAPHVGPAVGGEVPNWLEAMRRTEPKRDVALAPIRGLVDEAVRSFFERRSCKEPKVGPATGQPRTEAPLAADGSGTVVELGEAFRQNLSNAVACLPEGAIDPTTIKIAIRNLHACVAEMAKVVERIGARS